jgi:putative ABC transport system permease protein
MEHLRKVWDDIAPGYPFEFQYNNEYYFQAYKKEIVQSRMTSAFSLLAILISCMGLFAISSIIITQRTKEIGIRKTNGAKTSEIIFMLIKDFSKWVVIAFIIACPVAFYFMTKWLENFAYKINIHWWVYALSGGIAFAVAFLTIIGQSYKAATRNPVEALRYE